MRRLILLILILSQQNFIHAQFCFLPKVVYKAGINAGSICYSDFNNDGIIDLAVANRIGTISILTGNANGTFVSPQEYHTGIIASSICTGDFNNDSIADLATSDGGPFDVRVVFGDGTGAFGMDSIVAQIVTPRQIISADFNKDGFADLAVGTPFKLYLLYGNGLGQFTDSIYGSGFSYTSITVADFNNDTWPDIAMTNPPYEIGVLLNNGSGQFGSPAVFNAGVYPYWICSADFNFDGNVDVATANNLNDKVMVFLNNGSANFSLVDSAVVGDNPECIVAADLTGDSIIDLATANNYSSDISLLQGDGTGNFTNMLTLHSDTYPNSIISADFNGDQKNDVAIVTTLNNTDTGHVEVYINCFTAGIVENESSNIHVFPNPSDGVITVDLFKSEKVNQMQLIDFSGKVIFHSDHYLDKIDLRNEPKGIYLLRICDGTNWYSNRVIII